MAVIAITDQRIWHGSASILRYVVAKLNASGGFPQYHQRFSEIENGWQALDIREMNVADLAKVRSAVSELLSAVRASGPAEHGGDAHYNGLLARLSDLQQLLDAEIMSAQS